MHVCAWPTWSALWQEHALSVLQKAADQFEHPAFPCALIAGGECAF